MISECLIEKVKKELQSLLEKDLLIERKVDLDRYYINRADSITNELKIAICEYEDYGYSDKLIDAGNGFKFIPTNNDYLPDIYLLKRNKNKTGMCRARENFIVLYILDNNNKIDTVTKNIINTEIESIIAHELSHYYDDISMIGAGRSLNKKYLGQGLTTTYCNDKNEINAVTKELEKYTYQNVLNIMNTIKGHLNITLQKSLLQQSINNLLNICITDPNNRFYQFLQLTSQENKNKIYKDVYNYCIEEYITTGAFYNYLDGDEYYKLQKQFHNSDLLNNWLKQHKF